MERTHYIQCILILILCFCRPFFLGSQSEYKSAIYTSYIAGRIDKWEPIIKKMESRPPSSVDKKLELINYYYGYIGYLLGNQKNTQAKEYIKKGEILVDQVLSVAPDHPTALSYKGALLNFKIAMSKMKAIKLGYESTKYINKAIKLDPDNLQAILDKANWHYHAPKAFGGNKKEAIRLYKKGIALMETKKLVSGNWYYLNQLALLGLHYEEMKQYRNAIEIYEKALKTEPGFTWVKNELLPAVKKKTEQKK